MQLDWHWGIEVLQQFFHAGGPVLYLLAVLSVALITLVLERYWFKWVDYPKLQQSASQASSLAERLHRRCDLQLSLQSSLPVVKNLIALCPLIGLLGTVTGMIQVFDVLNFHGTGNARLMASGVARATLPTLCGMAVALVGLLFYHRLQDWSQRQLHRLQREEVHP